MIYQLPNGKVISITIEEYLELDKEDIQYLMSIDAGGYPDSPFIGSGTNPNDKDELELRKSILEEDVIEDEIDFGGYDLVD